MRGVSKLVLPLALLALLAFGLSACGGGDSTTGSTAATTQESTAPSGEGQGSDQGKEESADEASASFRVKGGDNSIQDYGEEADSSEVAAASAALSSYLKARAAGNWATQCAELAKSAVAPLEQLGANSPQLKGKGCAAILKLLMGRAPASTRANPLSGDVASLRFEGDRGFALFHGAGGTDYFVAMVKEDGKWKVGAIAPSEFP
jgi:hypothetical protein